VRRELEESIAVKRQWSDELIGGVFELARRIGVALDGDGKVVLFGNGGSAADAQHIAAELTARYLRERRPLRAMVLHGNTSAVTAIANDYEWEAVYERQVLAWVQPQDRCTSGRSWRGCSRRTS
jgi:D-sedoheptulose 7-phosphate isomerase